MHAPQKKLVTKAPVPGKIPFISKSRKGQSAGTDVHERSTGAGTRAEKEWQLESVEFLFGVLQMLSDG